MRIRRALEPPLATSAPLYVAAGMFDGVHRGHQAVIGAAIEAAFAHRGEAWVLTFDPHPLAIIAPDRSPPTLTPLPYRLKLFEQLGVDGVLAVPFTRGFSRLTPEDFIETLLQTLPTMRQFIVGPEWRFGRDAVGDPDLLRSLAHTHGFEAVIANKVRHHGAKISSTTIRDAIQAGRFEDARELLGRPYTLFGTVVSGRRVGRKLGYPTANIIPTQEVLPPHGVFAVQAEINTEILPGAAYYGHRSLDPNQDQNYVLETHLFDFDRDLYQQEIGVRLISFIRPDQRFDSQDALKQQIQEDTIAIRDVLAAEKESGSKGRVNSEQ